MQVFLVGVAGIIVGYLLLRRFAIVGRSCKSKARLDGKTVIITGANTGIGKETAKDMANRGAKVILACRDTTKADKAAAELIRDANGSSQIVVRKLNLASTVSIRDFAEKILKEEDRLDILINNAGIMMCPQWETEDGFEMQMGTNHLGHFLLTNLLLDLIKKSAPSRIVTVSSVVHKFTPPGGIDFEDMNCRKKYDPTVAYAKSKLANILFTRELAKRLQGTGVTTYTLHPGSIQTELQRTAADQYFWGPLVFNRYTYMIFFKTPKQGTQTTIFCAVDESVAKSSGKYYDNCAEAEPNKLAQDDEAARRLWEVSAKMVGLDNK